MDPTVNSAASGNGEVLSDGGFRRHTETRESRWRGVNLQEQKSSATALLRDKFSIPVYLCKITLTNYYLHSYELGVSVVVCCVVFDVSWPRLVMRGVYIYVLC